MDFAPIAGAWLHLILDGGCWLGVENSDPHFVEANSAVYLPRGIAHWLANDPSSSRIESEEATRAWLAREPIFANGDKSLHLVCGAVLPEVSDIHPLFSSLPPSLVIDVETPSLARIVRFLREEANAARRRDLVIDRLAEILVIQILRQERQQRGDKSAFDGVQDTRIARALELVHGDLRKTWEIGELATAVGMSRSVFARVFADAVGEPPLKHIAKWRMARAARLLSTTSATVFEVAIEVGYSSETSFAKAFKRHYGHPPRFRGSSGSRADRTAPPE